MNRVLRLTTDIAGMKVAVPQPPVNTQEMNFSDYLSKPCYAAACRNLLKPADLKNMKLDRGDFDILIIHREYGLLACEIKSVGVNSVARAHTDDPVALINAAVDLVYLVGPPGTGKTLMLVVSALEWLRDPLDLHIHILVSSAKAVAASHYIQQQLQVTAREIIGEDAAGRVHVTEADLADKNGAELDSVVEKAVDILAMTARDGQICLIVDEASNMK
nr:hypothetical protein BaRGS_011710 [Batillaria attramentaria]